MDDTSSSTGVMIGILAIVAIVVITYLAIQAIRKQPAADSPNTPVINVHLDSSATPKSAY